MRSCSRKSVFCRSCRPLESQRASVIALPWGSLATLFLQIHSRLVRLAEWTLQEKNYSRNPGFTETRLRPLARRRDSTALPLFVFIRVRKPCTLERRRRLG